MKIGRLRLFAYLGTEETGYVFGVRSYRYGVHNKIVREEHGTGFVVSVVLFDLHICVDVKLSLPVLRETRRTGRVAVKV